MPRKPAARILKGTPRNLELLARRLRAGDIVGVPTETVYGLAADALNPAACRKIFEAKGRPVSDPLIVHLHSLHDLAKVAVANSAALKLAETFWPGPLTLVLPKLEVVPSIVSAGLPSVAVRVPAHPLFRRLLKLVGRPLAAPSANPFGYISPTTAEHVRSGLGTKIRYILDGGASGIGLESTIVDLRNPAKPRLLRPGAITEIMIEESTGLECIDALGNSIRVSGSLENHYAPVAKVSLCEVPTPGQGFIALASIQTPPGVIRLASPQDDEEFAQILYTALRQADIQGLAEVVVIQPIGIGIAVAIRDRLSRAANGR